MNKLKCLLGFCSKKLIAKQITKEIDSYSGIHLTRNVYHCECCHKTLYKRTDMVIGITKDNNWTWVTTDYYL